MVSTTYSHWCWSLMGSQNYHTNSINVLAILPPGNDEPLNTPEFYKG